MRCSVLESPRIAFRPGPPGCLVSVSGGDERVGQGWVRDRDESRGCRYITEV